MTALSVRDRVNQVPFTPGVYLMKDAAGEILYIGKARALRKRLRSYLTNKAQLPKLTILMSKVADIDYVETPTEVDALLLEAQLIRKYQPRYNKELKDDKSYPLLKITHERFPRIHLSRNRTDKKALYYGPFTDAKLLREAINLINALFPIRKCQKLPKTACLYYHIGQCLAPCIKPEIEKEYQGAVQEIRGFLGGGKKSFVDYLTQRMQESAEELRFEDAQFFKEQIIALGKLKKKRFSINKEEASVALSATLDLKKLLQMETLPEKIVCFDVSNIQGDHAVASKVSFYRELPNKLEYRRYRIKSVEGINDYAMIQEALGRMLRGLKEGRETFIPDVIMIDGGKGHLSAAEKILREEGFEDTTLITLAKRFETVYLAKTGQPVAIARNAPALYLLQKARDEAHRFAITYHRSLKIKTLRRSVLDDIPGIGESRKKILLENFNSMDELKRTGVEQLAGLPGMNGAAAQKVWEYFHSVSS
jgi:excinuclease ABC subunit C